MTNEKRKLLSAAEKIKSFGFRVFVSDSEIFNYLYFTDEKNIGYMQNGQFWGVNFSTVNKSGGNYSCQDWDKSLRVEDITIEDCKNAFALVPKGWRISWQKRNAIKKYADWNEFYENPRNSGLIEI